jgi:hypothetical protein
MTTETTPETHTQRPIPKRSGGQIATIVAGAVLALGGIGAGLFGGGLLGLLDGDDSIDSGRHSLSTKSTALVSDVAEIDDADDVDVLGEPTIRLSVHATAPTAGLFVGVGKAADVERYLADAPIDEVTDFDVDPFVLERQPRVGFSRPDRPADADFWVAEGSGRDAATLRWKVRDGDYRLVLMNADGSRHVRADGDVGVAVPHLRTSAWLLIGGGLLLVLGGGAAIAVAIRRRTR